MIRAVLAVVLAAALLGASLPAIDDARRDHADVAVRTELDRFERAARTLLSEDDPVSGDGGARRVVVLSVPEESWTDADVAAITVASPPERTGGRLTWRLRGGPQSVRRLPSVPLRTPDGDPIVVESSGRHRLVLSLDGSPADPVVTVRRFTSDEATSAAHAVAIDGTRGIARRVRL